MAETETMDQAVKVMAEREGKYLTFTLAEEEYGIGILKIKEIIGMLPITSVPQTPEFVKGVINLRGKVIPVIDLRLLFGMGEIDSEVHPSTFLPHFGCMSHKLTNSEHILAFPARRSIKDFVHHVALPEFDNLLGFCERLGFSCDADVSPHKGP